MLEADGFETWKADKKGMTGEGWIGIFNRTDEKASFEITSERRGLDGTGYTLTDVWSDEEKAFGKTIKLSPHGVLFVKFVLK